jgi:hypothetical protein
MKKIGGIVQESIDLMERGHFENSFVTACVAFQETIKKSLEKEELALFDYKNFIDEHWDLLFFICFPVIKTPYLEEQFVIKEISLNPRRTHTIKEIVVFLLTYVLRNGRMPPEIKFFTANNFEVNDDTLFVPSTLLSGILAITVVHPINRDEKIGDKYWISISDFKMFISELWGRMDLAERVRKFYLTRD